jgi:hypothetical protein
LKAAKLVGLLGIVSALFLLTFSPAPSIGNDQPDPFTRFIRDRGHEVSQSALIKWYTNHPEDAPPQLRQAIETLRSAPSGLLQQAAEISEAQDSDPALAFGQKRFNKETDATGLPQNEESVTYCPVNQNEILMGTNDFRGLVDVTGNTTGWHYSKDGGASVFKEGRQAEISVRDSDGGLVDIPSGGDPVVRAVATASDSCDFYAAGLAFDLADDDPNAIVVYKTSDETLNGSCQGAACWPSQKAVATATIDLSDGTGHFLDKPWMDVGDSGGDIVVWVTYTEFEVDGEVSPIKASRCTADLTSCTSNIAISSLRANAQFSYVTIAPDGRVYVSWIERTIDSGREVFTINMRMAAAGSTSFGPRKTVATETRPLGFGSSLSSNDFRIASIPQNTVLPLDDGVNRFYVVWPYCVQPAVPVDGQSVEVCRDSDIRVAFSDDDGDSFRTVSINQPGSQYFPAIDADVIGDRVYRYQTVVANGPPDLGSLSFVSLNHINLNGDVDCDRDRDAVDALGILEDVAGLGALPSGCPAGLNEPNADPALGGQFIGDYIEVFAYDNVVVVGYNANYTELGFLGTKPATYQQDNYLGKLMFP